MSYQAEAEAPFDPTYPDDRITEWGPAAEHRRGVPGLCWQNARDVAGAASDLYFYAEGLAFNHGEWSGHGWVVRKSDGQVVECTDGYETSSAYRGICLEVAEVEEFIDGRPLVKGRSCRERWRTTYPDGSTRSEAPGVITILAEEVIEQGSDMFEWHRELSRWLDRGMANGRSLPGRD